jgi:hypothetical protein
MLFTKIALYAVGKTERRVGGWHYDLVEIIMVCMDMHSAILAPVRALGGLHQYLTNDCAPQLRGNCRKRQGITHYT